jgi:hypothetical protein
VVAVVADGSPALLAAPVVLVVAVQAAAVDHPEQVVLLEQMVLVVAAVAVLPLHPQRVPVDQELSLFVTRCQTFQNPILIQPTTPAPTQTTSLQQLH